MERSHAPCLAHHDHDKFAPRSTSESRAAVWRRSDFSLLPNTPAPKAKTPQKLRADPIELHSGMLNPTIARRSRPQYHLQARRAVRVDPSDLRNGNLGRHPFGCRAGDSPGWLEIQLAWEAKSPVRPSA